MRLLVLLFSVVFLRSFAHFRRPVYFDSDESFEKRRSANDDPEGDVYALIVAGSNGWYNYRHQADTAHAYHTLIAHGVKKENIITMMYDDIANNAQNPYKGKLYNNPDGKVDVYAGVDIDYRGDDVTPENFINILTGNKSAVVGGNGKVLESGKSDRVFVFFSDHGAVGLISFPNGILTVKQLNDAIVKSRENGKFDTLLFYLEACESGSMFEHILAQDINVFAVTAANGKESSWGTYCENKLGLPCLGDLFSVSWMEDSDVEDLKKETVGDQFELVKKETNKSHVMKYGDDGVEKDPVAWFQGMTKSKTRKILTQQQKDARVQERLETAVPSRVIEEYHLKKALHSTNDERRKEEYQAKLNTILKTRNMLWIHMKGLVNSMLEDGVDGDLSLLKARRSAYFSITGPVAYPQCHHDVISTYDIFCFSFAKFPDALRFANVLNNACNDARGDSEAIVNVILNKCAMMRPF